MKIRDVTCPTCGTMNYKVDLEDTDGWMECVKCCTTVLVESENIYKTLVFDLKTMQTI